MVLNAKGYYNVDDMYLEKFYPLWSAAAGTIERGASFSSMQRISGLLGILCFASDLMQRPEWRVRTWRAIGLAGVSVTLFGLVERIADAPMIFWEASRIDSTFFGTYFYRGNAGAFINLVLPLIFGLALVALHEREAHGQKSLWIPAVLVCVAGAFVNTARSAQIVTAIIVIVLVSWCFKSLAKTRQNFLGRRHILYAGIFLIALVVVAEIGWTSVGPRWSRISEEIGTLNGRTFAMGVCYKMIPDAGLMGFGPGTFEIGFPFYITPEQIAHVEVARMHWRYAHEDYLQTLIEWGWVGFAAWAVLFCGGVVTALYTINYRRLVLSSSDHVLLFTCVTALVGIAIHALVDFPLQIASLQLYTAVFLGTCWGSRNWSAGQAPREPRGVRNP